MTALPGADRGSLLPALDRSWYVDPQVFAAEQEAIFAKRWMLAGRSSEIAETGAYLTVTVADDNVIVVRQADGTAAAMLNVCRHRGARILLDDHGVCNRVIRCPYHAWAYGFDGSLRGAPNLREWVNDDQESLGLQTVAVHEQYGCLWVNLDPGGVAWADDIGVQIESRMGDSERIDAWELDRLQTGRRIVYDIAANWKHLIENFMECYHCTSIHPELVHVIPEFRGGVASQANGAGYGSAIGEQVAGFTVDGRAGLEPLPLVPEEDRRRYFGMTIRSTAFFNLVGDHAIIHRISPVSVDRTTLVCDWLFAPEALAAGADIDATVELFHRVNLQDFEACERCQLGATSRTYAHHGVLVPTEHHLEGFYDEVRQAVTGA
jgi:glycine betaine catabolism A